MRQMSAYTWQYFLVQQIQCMQATSNIKFYFACLINMFFADKKSTNTKSCHPFWDVHY